ncbi:hypothetical protein [Fimbriiglobus ruber]|uniref:Type II secretion system protein GspG C-terminal domain-containing protein n=1 Tax=Fimbriiglobus ruber TaxID=1908690 RepID=A0A225DCC3_9BACT|nr:hypothetical protein [Fimbriiglobus ruber]OWK34789.1 hypothetical protein FRUB_09631 [Fimbriiglobus ruber]
MKKWLRRAAYGTVVLLALLVVGIVIGWYSVRAVGFSRRDAIIAKLDAEDPNWRAADLCATRNATLPPPDRNAADIAVRAATVAPQALFDFRFTYLLSGPPDRNHFPEEADLGPMVELHSVCSGALKVARPISHVNGGGLRFDFPEPNPQVDSLPKNKELRYAGSLLLMDAIVRANQGKPNDAIESVRAILNIGKAVGDEPTVLAQMLHMFLANLSVLATEWTLGWGTPTAGLEELQAALANELKDPRLTHIFRGKRAEFFLLSENLDAGQLSLSDFVDEPVGDLQDHVTTRVCRLFGPSQQATVFEVIDRILAADKLTGPERIAAFDAVQVPKNVKDYKTILAAMPFVGWEAIKRADDQVKASLGAAVVALACERYRLKFGSWPKSLSAIPSEILTEVPVDPYTGGPLLYKILPDAVVVYSTGPDMTDDGGTALDTKGGAGTDIGFRLWNPKLRGLPPLSKMGGGAKPLGTPNSNPRP